MEVERIRVAVEVRTNIRDAQNSSFGAQAPFARNGANGGPPVTGETAQSPHFHADLIAPCKHAWSCIPNTKDYVSVQNIPTHALLGRFFVPFSCPSRGLLRENVSGPPLGPEACPDTNGRFFFSL